MKLNTMPSVRLRATIAIDVDAADYLEAAEHQKKLNRTSRPCAPTIRKPPSP